MSTKTKGYQLIDLSNSDRFFVVYYLFLWGLLLLLIRPNSSYGLAFRFVYFGLFIVPFFFKPKFLPAVIVCFYGVCDYGFYSLLPDSYIFLFGVVLVVFVLNVKKLNINSKEISCFLLFFVFTFLVSLINHDFDQNFIRTGLLFLLIYHFIQNKSDLWLLSMGLCLMSFSLALLYVNNISYYSIQIAKTDFETGAWENVNVLAGCISLGLPLSLALLLGIIKGYNNFFLKVFLIIACILITFTVVSIASRGALFAGIGSSVLMILFSKIKTKTKIISFVIALFVLIVLFQNGVFDYVIYRMTELGTTSTAGKRTIIWSTKLNAFHNTSIVTLLFGMGRHKCDHLGVYYSTHNDFVTSIVGFGYCGFIIFLSMILVPIIYSKKQNVINTIVLSLCLIIECTVVEPIFRGYIPFFAYYFLILKKTWLDKQE